jgi:hypothetical protein
MYCDTEKMGDKVQRCRIVKTCEYFHHHSKFIAILPIARLSPKIRAVLWRISETYPRKSTSLPFQRHIYLRRARTLSSVLDDLAGSIRVGLIGA